MTDKIAYVINPATGRPIKVDGATYLKLKGKYKLGSAKRIYKSPPKAKYTDKQLSEKQIAEILGMPIHQYNLETSLKYTTQPYLIKKLKQQIPKKTEGRGSRTRGWASDKPKRGHDRHLLKEKCGDKCFLMPEHEGFPICPRCFNDVCKCEIDCRGLIDAKIRARQYKYNNVNKAIADIEKTGKCAKK